MRCRREKLNRLDNTRGHRKLNKLETRGHSKINKLDNTGAPQNQQTRQHGGSPPVGRQTRAARSPPGLGLERAGGRVVGLPAVVGEDAVARVEEGAVLAVQAVLPLELPVHGDAVVPQHRTTVVPAAAAAAAATVFITAAGGCGSRAHLRREAPDEVDEDVDVAARVHLVLDVDEPAVEAVVDGDPRQLLGRPVRRRLGLEQLRACGWVGGRVG